MPDPSVHLLQAVVDLETGEVWLNALELLDWIEVGASSAHEAGDHGYEACARHLARRMRSLVEDGRAALG